jgi:uncharacterized protein with GYD domain
MIAGSVEGDIDGGRPRQPGGPRMPKYLWKGSYSPENLNAMIGGGGACKRHADMEKIVERAGGRLESLYWAFGEHDFYAITEFPDNSAAAALSMAIARQGSTIATVALLTADEVDAAIASPMLAPRGEK